MTFQPRIAMVAGEASGDLLGGLLLAGMRGRWPQLSSQGIGGPAMAAQGFEAWWPHERLAVRGYAEVLPKLPGLLRMRKQLRERLLANKPDVFIGVDAPDFNLDLEVALRQGGVPTVHFVSPSFWAWRADKVNKLKAAADHVLCIFPFEPDLLAQHGVPATFVGHPLANVIPLEPDQAAARVRCGIAADGPVVALLPGSREAEVCYLAQVFCEAAALAHHQKSAIHFVVPALPALRPAIERAVAQAGLGACTTVLAGRSHDALAACDVALVASGTATLEAALFKRPMVIAYKMHPLSWRMMKDKALQPWVGLPNILCREFVVPELIQEAATPPALAQALCAWLDDEARAQALKARFHQLHRDLMLDTASVACDVVADVIQRGKSPAAAG